MTHKHGAVYRLAECVICCATLVMSARPSKERAQAMLAHISRVRGAPERKEILLTVSQMIEAENANASI